MQRKQQVNGSLKRKNHQVPDIRLNPYFLTGLMSAVARHQGLDLFAVLQQQVIEASALKGSGPTPTLPTGRQLNSGGQGEGTEPALIDRRGKGVKVKDASGGHFIYNSG